MPEHNPCPKCGSTDCELVCKTPIARGSHFIDYKKTLRCRGCGERFAVGGAG